MVECFDDYSNVHMTCFLGHSKTWEAYNFLIGNHVLEFFFL